MGAPSVEVLSGGSWRAAQQDCLQGRAGPKAFATNRARALIRRAQCVASGPEEAPDRVTRTPSDALCWANGGAPKPPREP